MADLDIDRNDRSVRGIAECARIYLGFVTDRHFKTGWVYIKRQILRFHIPGSRDINEAHRIVESDNATTLDTHLAFLRLKQRRTDLLCAFGECLAGRRYRPSRHHHTS